MGQMSFRLSAALIFFSAFVFTVRADHMVLKDGTAVDCGVTCEDSQKVSIEVSVPNSALVLTKQITKASIKSWQRVARQGAPYVVIPVMGEIGKDTTAEALRVGLEQAKAAHPKYVVLAIDSPGGSIAEMAAMVDILIDASKQLQIIAYVKSAYSAAAVITMCCTDVYMKPDAAIGAAVPFRITENGPAEVDAKFRSAFSAKIRASTAHGQHADLLIRGMSEGDLEIYLTQENGQPVLKT